MSIKVVMHARFFKLLHNTNTLMSIHAHVPRGFSCVMEPIFILVILTKLTLLL